MIGWESYDMCTLKVSCAMQCTKLRVKIGGRGELVNKQAEAAECAAPDEALQRGKDVCSPLVLLRQGWWAVEDV